VAIWVNSWITIFSYNTLERHFQGIIDLILSDITTSSLFFLKLVFTVILSLIIFLLGTIAGRVSDDICIYWMDGIFVLSQCVRKSNWEST
jgi:hypothetical protein